MRGQGKETTSQDEIVTRGRDTGRGFPVNPGTPDPEVVQPCARSRLVVKTPPKGMAKGGSGRIAKLRKDRDILRTGLTRTPYVEISWTGEDGIIKPMVGLVDTGADWSLIEESELRDQERKELAPSAMSGKGVTEAEIPIVGEVWRDVSIGGISVKDQRFIVVTKMITPIILGADFWGRFGELSLNFKEHKLSLGGVTVELLKSATSGDVDTGQVFVLMEEEAHVPPFTEMVVQGHITGKKLKRRYLSNQ